MEKLLTELKKRCDNSHILITSHIDFNYDDKLKTIHMVMKKGIKQNMQKDAAAFEGWALALKANLEDLVSHITLDWDTENEPINKNSKEWRHFNRFLYRVDAFSKQYSKWFTVLNKQNSWEDRIKQEGWGDLVLNSIGNRSIINKIDKNEAKSEHDLETYFASKWSEKLRKAVKEHFNIEIGDIKNQYPVGIFNNQVKAENYIFTGGKSAIDLYSIVDNNSFNIFELKTENNVKVGILSELFFYSSLIKDVIDGKFRSESSEFNKVNKVNAFFLVQKIHSLISDKVIEMLNLPNSNISYRKLIYRINDVELTAE